MNLHEEKRFLTNLHSFQFHSKKIVRTWKENFLSRSFDLFVIERSLLDMQVERRKKVLNYNKISKVIRTFLVTTNSETLTTSKVTRLACLQDLAILCFKIISFTRNFIDWAEMALEAARRRKENHIACLVFVNPLKTCLK